MPKSSICLLQDVNIVQSVDPLEATSCNIGTKDTSLDDLGVDLSKSSLLQDHLSDATQFLEKWKVYFLLASQTLVALILKSMKST
jgi:hypothetical protein